MRSQQTKRVRAGQEVSMHTSASRVTLEVWTGTVDVTVTRGWLTGYTLDFVPVGPHFATGRVTQDGQSWDFTDQREAWERAS